MVTYSAAADCCPTCHGTGLVAPSPFDRSAEPPTAWDDWLAADVTIHNAHGWPPESSATFRGLIRPVDCPGCGGRRDRPVPQLAIVAGRLAMVGSSAEPEPEPEPQAAAEWVLAYVGLDGVTCFQDRLGRDRGIPRSATRPIYFAIWPTAEAVRKWIADYQLDRPERRGARPVTAQPLRLDPAWYREPPPWFGGTLFEVSAAAARPAAEYDPLDAAVGLAVNDTHRRGGPKLTKRQLADQVTLS